MLKLGLGMWLYDVLALFHAPKFHERLSSKGAQALLPTLTPDELKGAYLYSDAYMDDDRLVIETLRSAVNAGASVASYVRAGQAQLDHSGKIVSIEATDLESGKSLGMIRARHFISTVGPWTDLVGAGLFKTWKKLLRPSKGVHLVVPAHKIPTKSAVVMAEGKRIIFAIPRGDIVIVGTTDTDYPGNPEDVVTQKQDVDYLLKVVGEYFCGSELSEADIISSYAGVRPLVNDGSETESKTSREHVIKSTDHNVTFVAGGKYTTYRRMARDIVEVVLKREFPMEDRIKFARNNTREPINPQVTPEKLSRAIAQAPIWAKHYKIAPQISTVLAERHGDEAQKILNDFVTFRNEHPYLTMSLWNMEALFAVRETMCFHLKDFMLRRSPLYLTTKDHGRFCEKEVAAVMAIELGWSKEDIEKELADYHAEINRELAWRGNG
jgi:glycerol-3-phosphate dehydrogenase